MRRVIHLYVWQWGGCHNYCNEGC